jgi:alpha-tubulin suppressor-like RCC1 family protein
VGGQVGDGVATSDARLVPVRVAFPAGVTVRSIGTGLGTSYAVDADGRLWGWGQADDGALGPGVSANQVAPVLIGGVGDARFTQVVGTYRSAFALDDGGQVWAWGNNQDGQLGDGTTTERATPAVVAGIDGPVARIARMTADCCPGASAGHIAVLTAAGEVWTWGLNNRGQLGDGTTDGRATPAKVAGLDDLEVSGVAGGDERTIVWSNPASEPPDPTDPPVTDPTVPPTDPTVPPTDPTVPPTDPTAPPLTGPSVPATDPPMPPPASPIGPAAPALADQAVRDDDIPQGELARTGDHDGALAAVGMLLVVVGAVVLVERGRRFRQG